MEFCFDAAIGVGGDVENLVLKADAGDREGGPVFRKAWMHFVSIGGRLEAEKAIEHDLRDEHAFEKLLVHAETTGRSAALQRAAAGFVARSRA